MVPVYYQPIFKMLTAEICRAEALTIIYIPVCQKIEKTYGANHQLYKVNATNKGADVL